MCGSQFSVVLTDVGVFGGGEPAVGSLCAAQSELEQFDLVHVTRGDAVARGVRRYQAEGDDRGSINFDISKQN